MCGVIARARNVPVATLTICLCVGASFAMEPASVGSLTVAQLEQANRINAARVRTLVLDELVVQRIQGSMRTEDEARSRLLAAIGAQMEAVLDQAIAADASPATVRSLEEKYSARLASVDGALIVNRLNRYRSARRQVTIDFTSSAARYDDTDRRDIGALAEAYCLNEHDRIALDQSGSLIMVGGEPTVRLVPHADRLAVVGVGPGFATDVEARRLALIPSWVFSGNHSLQINGKDGAAELQIVGECEGKVSFVLTVRRDQGFRMSQITTFDPQGRVAEEFSASGFKQVDGIPVPLQTLTRRAHQDVPDYWLEQRSVQRVVLNPDLDADALFAIPSGFRVQDFRESQRLPAKDQQEQP
jgi:hypothetical protein